MLTQSCGEQRTRRVPWPKTHDALILSVEAAAVRITLVFFMVYGAAHLFQFWVWIASESDKSGDYGIRIGSRGRWECADAQAHLFVHVISSAHVLP